MTGKRDDNKPEWKSFEESAAEASTKLFPDKEVLADQTVPGEISGVLRQIDVKVGDADFIDIECKDHKAPVDVTVVEQFQGKLRDEGAGHGIIVSNSDFTKAALKTAAFYKIEPVVLVDKGYGDTSNFIIQAPVVARGLYIDGVRYGFEHRSLDGDWSVPQELWSLMIADDSDPPMNLYDFFRAAWNSGEYRVDKPGTYQLAFNKVPIVTIGGKVVNFDTIKYQYYVDQDLRLGKVGIEKGRGFYNVRERTFTSAEDLAFEPIEFDKMNDWPTTTAEALGDVHHNLELVGILPLPAEMPKQD